MIVNTCGFLNSAKAESLEAIGEALAENGRVIVTGCLGADAEYITGAHPRVLCIRYWPGLRVMVMSRPTPTRATGADVN